MSRACWRLGNEWMHEEWALGTLQLLATLRGLCWGMSELGHDVTATCNTNTKNKMKLKLYRKKVSHLEKEQENWTLGCGERTLLTIDHYQGAVKIEWGSYSKAAKRKQNKSKTCQ